MEEFKQTGFLVQVGTKVGSLLKRETPNPQVKVHVNPCLPSRAIAVFDVNSVIGEVVEEWDVSNSAAFENSFNPPAPHVTQCDNCGSTYATWISMCPECREKVFLKY
jgi:hypothetical protein